MEPFKLILNNLRTENIYVLLTANSTEGLSGITAGVPTPISAITNNIISANVVDSGRLYFISGEPTNNPPTPNGPDYYGWIEFSKEPSDCDGQGNCQLWINLSNVDISGMQLAISGIDTTGNPFSCGYKESAMATNRLLADKFIGSKIVTSYGETKILAPNHKSSPYPSFEAYLEELTTNSASMTIRSDTPTGGYYQTFSGHFLTGETIVKLKDKNNNIFEITKSNLTTKIIYDCDGGTIIYNGQTYPQNRSGQTQSEIVTNSVFRQIMLGLNEGYFNPSSHVNSCDFPSYTPFAYGGNMYAKEIHKLSNSYGFPYADSNLKVLITASASTTTPITVTICNDHSPFGYTDTSSTENIPACGSIGFATGAGCILGDVQIDSCIYQPLPSGIYTGFITSGSEWRKMYFSGQSRHIWFNATTKEVSIGTCLNGAQGTTWVSAPFGVNLAFPGGITINPTGSSPIKPSGTTF